MVNKCWTPSKALIYHIISLNAEVQQVFQVFRLGVASLLQFAISCFYALYVPCKDDKITCSKDCGEDGESSACYTADQAKGKPECKQATCNTRDDYNVRSYNASDPLVMTENRENDDVQYYRINIYREENYYKHLYIGVACALAIIIITLIGLIWSITKRNKSK